MVELTPHFCSSQPKPCKALPVCLYALKLLLWKNKSNPAQKAELRGSKLAEATSLVLAFIFKFKLQPLKDQVAKLLKVAAVLSCAHENLNEKFTCLLLICISQPFKERVKPHVQKGAPLLCDVGIGLCCGLSLPFTRAGLCLTSFFTISKMALQRCRLSGYAQLMPPSHTPAMTASFPDAPLCWL